MNSTVTAVVRSSDLDTDQNEKELQQVRVCIEQYKSLKTFFKHSGLKLGLEQECETTWNTKLEMVKSVLNAFDDIQSILLERGEMHRMSHISKDILQMLIHFLQTFQAGNWRAQWLKVLYNKLSGPLENHTAYPLPFSQDDPVQLRIMKHRWDVVLLF